MGPVQVYLQFIFLSKQTHFLKVSEINGPRLRQKSWEEFPIIEDAIIRVRVWNTHCWRNRGGGDIEKKFGPRTMKKWFFHEMGTLIAVN